MDKTELKTILEEHKKWLLDPSSGARADLTGAYLTDADLRGANLTGANLTGADLRGANLTGAYLTGAYLTDAYLTGADLRGADLRGANLTDAYLTGADLRGADLRGANLTGADLRGANLRGANLTGANLPHHQICPQEGAFTAWKALRNNGSKVVAKVQIPEDAQRMSSLVGRKCRASHILVLEGEGKSPTTDNKLQYKPGEIVRADKFDPDIRVECSHGIHFFMTRKEAEEWQ